MNIYHVNAALCAVACIGLCFAITADWRNVRPMWRPVLIAGAIEQAVLLYGCIEASRSHVEIETRQLLFSLSVAVLALAVLWALVRAWHSGELTAPGSAPEHGPTRRD